MMKNFFISAFTVSVFFLPISIFGKSNDTLIKKYSTFWKLSGQLGTSTGKCEKIVTSPHEFFQSISKKAKCIVGTGNKMTPDNISYECIGKHIHFLYFNKKMCEFGQKSMSYFSNNDSKGLEKFQSTYPKKKKLEMIPPSYVKKKQAWIDFYAGCIQNATASIEPKKPTNNLDGAYFVCRCMADTYNKDETLASIEKMSEKEQIAFAQKQGENCGKQLSK